MASRHVFNQRLKSGVIFSAPGNLLAMPEGGWGDDTPITRQKQSKRKVQSRGLDHFSHWVAKVTLGDEPYDNVDSFMPGKDTRGIGNEYRPYSVSPYPETEVEAATAKIREVTLCLPMLSVSLTATVDGTVAHTELLQKFHNPSDIIIDAAKHVFPLYDGAVITSFECTIGDERRVRGVVKPKVQARKEFEEAVRDKVAAPALLEEHTPEIFETSLGNIPANTMVEIKITYVQELKVVMMESEATEGIAVTIPMSIAPRYSKAPIEWEPASKLPEEKLDIWIKVLDNGKVNHEGCDEESGHLLQFEGSKPVEYSNLSEKEAAPKTYYVWHHVSEPAVLRKDFVFVIQMNEGHQIKSRAIACPADDKGLAAMMVNIRPNDLFRNSIIPQSFTGEILFLLDQSASMGWTNDSTDYYKRRTRARKIVVMREAMLLALSGIPSTCVFNVISWGSATMGLWETSRPHTKENIREAKSYVSQVEADMGGTDLLRALESVVKRRVQDRGSTQIIILTDGELEPEDSIQFIWKNRQLFGDSIRFFALGIGDKVSHRLVESIAECGGGYSDVVHTTQTPRWHDRLNRLLKSALEPNSWSCEIDLGSGFERKSLVDYKLEQQTTSESDKTPYIQGPFPISSLHPFSFASISFLVDLRHGGQLPKAVTISTTTAGAKKKTYQLPMELAPGNDRTIHRLVAKSVLLDLQDSIKRGTAETQIAKANAESIGTMYSIISKWTSFVAISENQPTQTVEEQKMNHYKALLEEIDVDELLNNVSDDETSTSGSFSGTSNIGGYGDPQRPPGMNSMAGPPMFNYPRIPGNPLTTGGVLEPRPWEAQGDPEAPPAKRKTGAQCRRPIDYPQHPISASEEPEERQLVGPRPRVADEDPRRAIIAISERLRERVNRRKKSAQADVPDEPMVPPSANRGFAIPAGIIRQGEPHASDDDGTGKGTEASEEAEVVERTPATANTSDDSTRYSVPDLPSSMPKDTPIHEFWDPALSLSPMPRATLDGDARLDGSATQTFRPHSATSQYRPPGPAPLSQASSQLNEYLSSGLTPQIQRGTVPGGPKFPTYKAMPIPNTRAHPFFGPIGRSAKQRRGASKCWESDYDSDDSSMSRGISESSSSQSNVYGPLDWQFAMECQDGQGLFDLEEKRPSLHLHFCPETATKIIPTISELLHNSTTPEEERDDLSARLLDTLMMIECYKTHRAQEEDTWDLMMERAWDAVISVLGFSNDEEALEKLAGQLRGAMMHAHYAAATGVKDSEKDDSSAVTVRCPACDVVWSTSRRFFCPFDHESDDVDEFTNWDDFWKHQVDQGHVVCPREVMN
ncbi:hypothetical protein H9Q69_004267 [Fusarium xylarioides]|nr:hypothetical protein H9Q69_004267 [Fusarium xylarioides]